MIIDITESTRWHDNGSVCTEPAGECIEDMDATPAHITVRDSDGWPADVVILPGPAFGAMFTPDPVWGVTPASGFLPA